MQIKQFLATMAAKVRRKLDNGVRRLRDAGKAWFFIFCYLIPIIGAVFVIYLLSRPSVPDNGIPVV